MTEEVFFVVESPPTFHSSSLLLQCDKLISTTLEMRGERGTLAGLNFAQLLLFGPRFVDLPLLAELLSTFRSSKRGKVAKNRSAGRGLGGWRLRRAQTGRWVHQTARFIMVKKRRDGEDSGSSSEASS